MASINNTIYQVVQNGRILASGNLRQCWMYLINAYGESMAIAEIADLGISIEPAGKGE